MHPKTISGYTPFSSKVFYVSDEVDSDNSVPIRTDKFLRVSQPESSGKKPIIAAILNLIIAGLGHVYIGRAKRGIVLFLLTTLIAAISSGLGWILGVIVCSYDVYQLAKNRPAPFDFLDEYIEKYWP